MSATALVNYTSDRKKYKEQCILQGESKVVIVSRGTKTPMLEVIQSSMQHAINAKKAKLPDIYKRTLYAG